MKKAIFVFILVSALAGNAFAQLTFSGSAYAGVRFQNPVGDGETITTHHREEGVPRFNFTATAMRENYGVRLDTTFTLQDDEDAENLTLNGIYGWVDFDGPFGNDPLRLTMGRMSSTPWVLPRFHHSHSVIEFGDIRGFRVEYTTPLPGLSVGFALRGEGLNLESTFERAVAGAIYIHPMFSAVFAYDWSANGQAMFGFNFTGIPDLTAAFQLEAGRLASWDDDLFFGTIDMRQKLGYRVMRPLNVFLIMQQSIENNSDSDVGLQFIPGIEYRILPDLTGSFKMIIESPDHFSTTNLTLETVFERTLRGPATLYVEYSVRFDDMDIVTHTFGFGITIRAF